MFVPTRCSRTASGGKRRPPHVPALAGDHAYQLGSSMLFVFTMRLQSATERERVVARLRGRLPKPTGFLTPESLRPDPRLALRGVLGLMLPVLLGRALDLPALDLVGIAAFLLTFGDVTGSEEPRQLIRLAIGTVLGTAAFATSVAPPPHTPPPT